jgi:hypothetical protein
MPANPSDSSVDVVLCELSFEQEVTGIWVSFDNEIMLHAWLKLALSLLCTVPVFYIFIDLHCPLSTLSPVCTICKPQSRNLPLAAMSPGYTQCWAKLQLLRYVTHYFFNNNLERLRYI